MLIRYVYQDKILRVFVLKNIFDRGGVLVAIQFNALKIQSNALKCLNILKELLKMICDYLQIF